MKVLLQDEMSECGLVCIAMIAEHYGKNKSISELRRNYKLDRNGLSFLNIETIFSEQEISACSYELKFENLHELTLPSIIQWNHNHFVVLSRIGNKYIEVYDPAIGKKRYDIDIAKQMFSGFAINVEPPLFHEGGEKIRKGHSLLSFTLRLNRIRIWCIFYCCLIFFSQVFSLITPKYLSLVVDKVLPSSDHELLIFMSLGFAFVYVFDFLNNLTSNFLRSRIVFKIGKALSIESFNKLIKQDYRYFKTRNLADIIKRTTFISDYGSYLLESYINSSMNIVFSIIFYGLILYIDTNAFIIVAIISFLFAIVRLSLVKRFEMLQGSLISNESSRNEAIKNIFHNIKTIKVNKTESSVLNQISKINNQCLKRFCNIIVLEENGKSLYLLTNNVCTILLVYCYLQSFFINGASVGNLFLLFFYKEFLFRNIASAVESVIYINKHKYEVDLASEIIFSSTEAVSYKRTAGDHDKIRKIEIKKGCLSYSSFSEPIFSSLNLILNVNHKVAITGRSGAGKSSLLTVLSSINRLSSGDFLVNNIPLDTFGIYEYRRKVGVYFSDEELKNETILKNITDDEFFDDNFLFEVLEKVGLNDEINSFHAGLYTLLGNGGVQLSSGQKQRLMIARALFKKPDILLLDEPTSFLDEYNTSLICKIISEFDGLCLVVSHDSRLLSCCDLVYNLKDLDGA